MNGKVTREVRRETGTGTDKTAGELARFYMAGTSHHVIRFIR